MRNVVAMVLGGGRGTRLFPLTSIRSKPAVPLAGMYRLIDIPISNCINSQINQIYVLTQFMSVSLHRHIRRSYVFDHFSGGFVEILAAQETMSEGTDWYQGTADAVRKNLGYVEQRGIEYVLILSGDQLYRMDYGEMIRQHRESGADATIACRPVSEESARAFGVMRLDKSGRVIGFLEKPQSPEELQLVRVDPETLQSLGCHDPSRPILASMGIYVFNRDVLHRLLTMTQYHDFGKEIFPATIRTHKVQTYLFDGYWEDIGTIRSFYEANISLAADTPPFRIDEPAATVYSRARFLPPTRCGSAAIKNSLIAGGCHICDGATIENSIIGLRTVISPGAIVRNSIIMGADYQETDSELAENLQLGRPAIGIGRDSLVNGAIVDKNVRIGRQAEIVNDCGVDFSDLPQPACVIRDGIPILIKGSVIADNWRLSKLLRS